MGIRKHTSFDIPPCVHTLNVWCPLRNYSSLSVCLYFTGASLVSPAGSGPSSPFSLKDFQANFFQYRSSTSRMSGVASILLVSRFSKSDTTLSSPRRPVRSCSIRSDWELCVRSRPVWVVDLSHARSRYFVFMSRRDSRPIALANAPSPNH